MRELKIRSSIVIFLVLSFIMAENSIYAISAEKDIEMKTSDGKFTETSLISCGDTSQLERVFVKAKIGSVG